MKGARPFGLALVAFAVMGTGGSADAQAVVLAPAEATLEVEFSSIRAIRELSDGRLLVTDRGDNRLVIADFATQTVRPIGRTGAGPGEVRHFGRLFALGGDSTILADEPEGRRWLVLAGDSIVATLPPEYPLIRLSSGAPRGADRAGHMVLTRVVGQVRSETRTGMRLVDSVAVLFVDRRSIRVDTLMRVRHVDQRVEILGPRAKPFYILRQAYLSSIDAVSISPDGWIAIATQDPYRVTWRSPDGRMIRGPELPWPRIAVNRAERRAHEERSKRVTGYPLAASEAVESWAEIVAPFGGEFVALHAPDGRLLLRKMPWSRAEGTRYDVIDRAGRAVGELVLAENEWLVGFGARSVYSVIRDEDGLQWLRRHRWPRIP